MLDSITQEKSRDLVPAAVSLAVALMTLYALSYTLEPFDQIYVLKAYVLLWIHTSNVLPTIKWWPYGIINNTVGSVFRLLFVYEIYRCYKKRAGWGRAIAMGILSELWTAQFFFFSNILYPSSLGWYSIPVPLLLIIGLLFLVLIPPRKPKGLWEEEADSSHSQS